MENNKNFVPMSTFLSGALGETIGNLDNQLYTEEANGQITTYAAKSSECSGC